VLSVTISDNVRIAANGRLVVPKAIRQAAGISGESRLSISVVDGEIRLVPAARNAERAQALFRKYVKRDFTAADFVATRERD